MPSQSGLDFKEYVHNLSGSQRPIAAYLSEMLDTLPVEMVDFMLRTAILDRLSAPLCEAVTGLSSSRTILASLAQRQMLLDRKSTRLNSSHRSLSRMPSSA